MTLVPRPLLQNFQIGTHIYDGIYHRYSKMSNSSAPVDFWFLHINLILLTVEGLYVPTCTTMKIKLSRMLPKVTLTCERPSSVLIYFYSMQSYLNSKFDKLLREKFGASCRICLRTHPSNQNYQISKILLSRIVGRHSFNVSKYQTVS